MAEPITTIQYFSFEIGGYNHDYRKIIIKDNSFELTKSIFSYAELRCRTNPQWEIEIKYNHKKTLKKYYGSNEFPFVDKTTNSISSKILDDRPVFIKLLKVLNKLIKKKNFFSV